MRQALVLASVGLLVPQVPIRLASRAVAVIPTPDAVRKTDSLQSNDDLYEPEGSYR